MGSQARLVWQDAGQPPILYLSVGEKTDFGVQSSPSGHSVRNVEFTHTDLSEWLFAFLPPSTSSLLFTAQRVGPMKVCIAATANEEFAFELLRVHSFC